MSFGAKKNTRVRQDWSKLRVPRLPRRLVERLRVASRSVDNLAAIAELAPRNNTLVLVPAGERRGLFPDRGFEWIDHRLRVRLTATEIASLRERLFELIERIDRGEIALID
jgi:hypothetical protein